MKYQASLRIIILGLCMCWFTVQSYAQYQLTGVMINSCGIEGNQEFVTIRTTQEIDPNLINISYGSDGDCNTFVVFDMVRDIANSAVESMNNLAGCNAFQVAPSMIPADSEVFIIDLDFIPEEYEGWEVFCDRTIYVLFSQYENELGNFSNSVNTRFFCTAYDGEDLGTYDFTNTNRTVDGSTATWTDGPSSVESDIPESPNCGFGSIACTSPIFENPGNQTVCDTFFLPAILGENLSGNEAYFTASQGMGDQLLPGAFLLESQTLFIFDASSECSTEASFMVEVLNADNLPMFVNPVDTVVCDRYVLPMIAGQRLTEKEAYFDESNGAGNQFQPGDTLTEYNGLLFIYDTSLICSPQVEFTVSTFTTPTIDAPNDTLRICYTNNPMFSYLDNHLELEDSIKSGSDGTVFWTLDTLGGPIFDFANVEDLATLVENNPTSIFARLQIGPCFLNYFAIPLELQNVSVDFEHDTTLQYCPSELPVTFVVDQPGATIEWVNQTNNQITNDTAFMFDLDNLPFSLSLNVVQPNCPEQFFEVDLELSDDCPCEVIMPNAFTPNNDGANDTFFPVFSPDCIPLVEEFKLEVYNRWGQLVFESQNSEALGWDGAYNGNPAPSDVYVYIVEYRLPENNEMKQEKGDLTLIR